MERQLPQLIYERKRAKGTEAGPRFSGFRVSGFGFEVELGTFQNGPIFWRLVIKGVLEEVLGLWGSRAWGRGLKEGLRGFSLGPVLFFW